MDTINTTNTQESEKGEVKKVTYNRISLTFKEDAIKELIKAQAKYGFKRVTELVKSLILDFIKRERS